MSGIWNPIGADQQAYRTRWATLGRSGGESAELPAVRDELARGAMAGLREEGLKGAYGHAPGVIGVGEPPFFLSLPSRHPMSVESITLGGDDTSPGLPGGWFGIHAGLDCLICVGNSAGEYAALVAAAEEWLLPLIRFLLKNQTLGGMIDNIEPFLSQPDYQDVIWGPTTWYAVRVPLILRLQYIYLAG